MPGRPDLRLDWIASEAALYACRHWHYSRCLPAFKRTCIGVWESGRFIGAIVFAVGANRAAAGQYGLTQTECCELCRVALTTHTTPVSRILAIAIRLLRARNPGLRAILSYADQGQGHHGGIYQACGWRYLGAAAKRGERYIVHGKSLHKRVLWDRRWSTSEAWLRANVDPQAMVVRTPDKHKYILALDPALEPLLAVLTKPYPKRGRSADGGTAIPVAGGGSIPTRPLHAMLTAGT